MPIFFTPFYFNASCKFTLLCNFCYLIFDLIPCGWLHSVMLIPYLWWDCLIWLMCTLQKHKYSALVCLLFLFLPLDRKLSVNKSAWMKQVNLKILLLWNKKCKIFAVKKQKSVISNILHLLVNKRRICKNVWYTQFQNLKISHGNVYNTFGPDAFLCTLFLIYLCPPEYRYDFTVQTDCKSYCIHVEIFSSFESWWCGNTFWLNISRHFLNSV